jgi:hypothetical protein
LGLALSAITEVDPSQHTFISRARQFHEVAGALAVQLRRERRRGR